jgi:hypothetical protein
LRPETEQDEAEAPETVHVPAEEEFELRRTSAVPPVTVEPLSATAGIPIVNEPAPDTAPLAP